MPVDKWECDECGLIMPEAQIIRLFVDHPKPGHDRVSIGQCPECGEVNGFTAICDEPDCKKEVSCGWPTKAGGYRNTCYEHMKSNADQAAK